MNNVKFISTTIMASAVATVLMFASVQTPVNAGGRTEEDAIRTKVICKEGHKFLLVWTAGKWMPPSVVQIFEGEGGTRPAQPMKCR